MGRVAMVRARVELQMLGEVLADAERRGVTVSAWLREAVEFRLRSAEPVRWEPIIQATRDLVEDKRPAMVDGAARAGVEARKQAWLDRQKS